jgi:hypothetical protein
VTDDAVELALSERILEGVLRRALLEGRVRITSIDDDGTPRWSLVEDRVLTPAS